MRRRWMTILVTVTFLVVGGSAFGFGLPKLGGNSGAATVNQDEIMKRQSELVRSYMAASLQIANAQKHMAEAFGFKEQVEELDAIIRVLGSGNVLTKDGVEKVQATTKKMDKAISEKIEQNAKLSIEGKKCYKASIPPYLEGIAITAGEVAPEAKECFEWTKTQKIGRAHV